MSAILNFLLTQSLLPIVPLQKTPTWDGTWLVMKGNTTIITDSPVVIPPGRYVLLCGYKFSVGPHDG